MCLYSFLNLLKGFLYVPKRKKIESLINMLGSKISDWIKFGWIHQAVPRHLFRIFIKKFTRSSLTA